MREFSVTASLSSMTQFAFPVKNAPEPTNFNPCVFLLLASPLSEQSIHTHEYRAYQFRRVTASFDPKSMDIVNIGPAFRGHYGSFSPNAPFPSLACDFRNSPMNEDKDEGSLNKMKKVSKEQREMDMCAEGFDVASMSRLMGSQATNYTAGLEELYEKMLVKIENLASQVERSSAKVLEQVSFFATAKQFYTMMIPNPLGYRLCKLRVGFLRIMSDLVVSIGFIFRNIINCDFFLFNFVDVESSNTNNTYGEERNL